MKCTMAEPIEEHGPDCKWPNPPEAITTYCFGDTTEDERYRFEVHLLDCSQCWREVQRLDAVIRTIHDSKAVAQAFTSDIVGMIGISGKLNNRVAGHLPHAVAACAVYAGMITVSVFMEIAYQYNVFSETAWAVAPLVLVWVAGTTLFALTADWKLTMTGRKSGLGASVFLVALAAFGSYGMVRPFLPAHAITEASFQTWTAQAAFLKDVLYCSLFAMVFVLVPFNFTITMQRELTAARHRTALELLNGGKYAVAPRGAPYVPVWLLAGVLMFGALYSIVSTAHLLEALKMTAYSNLFIQMIEIRWLLFLVLGIESCWWYYAAVNELRRECAAVCRLASPGGQ